MDAVELIKLDHRHIEDLFARFLETEPEITGEDLFQQIQTALIAHAAIEERALYPAVRPFALERVEAGIKEHLEVRKILADWIDYELNEKDFESEFTELMGLVNRHIREDEGPNGILELARRNLDAKTLSRMTTQIIAIKRSIAGRLAA
jgi:hemerythrin superfamily protein